MTKKSAHQIIWERASLSPLRFLPGTFEDFCEKVDAVCEPGNRSIYTSPCFSYLQARKTGKTRMLLAKKKGVFNLYVSCRSEIKNSTYRQLKRFADQDKHSDVDTARLLAAMVVAFAEFLIRGNKECDGYVAEKVFPDGVEKLLEGSADPFKNLHLLNDLNKMDPGNSRRIVISFDDASIMIKDVLDNALTEYGRKRVNMLRWVRHCISSQVSGEFFWHCPTVFCDSSPEIDKNDPMRVGECVKIGRESPRVFMPLVLHDAFDLYLDITQKTAMAVNPRMAWMDLIRSEKYLLELAFHGRPAWGAAALVISEEPFNLPKEARDLKLSFRFVQFIYKEALSSGVDIRQTLGNTGKQVEIDAVIVMILASCLGVFDVHSTNMNLLFAKRCLSELLALDMDGRVCFATFPSEPLVACNYTANAFTPDLVGLIGRKAAELYFSGVISFDSAPVFVIQFCLLAIQQITAALTLKLEWADAVSGTNLATCLPRSCRSFLSTLSDRLDGFPTVLLDGIILFSHFATIDMDDLEDDLRKIGFVDADRNQSDPLHITRLDTVQIGLTLGRLVGRNAAGVVAEPWRGIDLIIPVICANGQLGALLIAVAEHGESEKLDNTLVELSMTQDQPLNVPAIGIVFADMTAVRPCQVGVKQLGQASKITINGYPTKLASLLGETTLLSFERLWCDS